MESSFEVIVLGLGAMGSAAAYHLARGRVKVLGLESFTQAHDQGSSHGESRIIRQSYSEDPAYVPLVLRAYELWEQLQIESGEDLLCITGGVAIGAAQGGLVAGCLKSAKQHGLKHELLDPGEMRRRFPQFVLSGCELAFYEEKAGYLKPEECIRQHLRLAARNGAELHFEEPVLSWTASASGDGVSVTTGKQTYRARSLVISAGPWFPELVPGLAMPVFVSRRVMFWMKPVHQPSAFDSGVFPVFMWEPEQGELFYGVPRTRKDGEPKVGIHSGRERCTPSTLDRSVDLRDEQAIRSALESRIPDLNGEVAHAAACMYTMTPDEHFFIDAHSKYPQVTLAAGFSGHGFKFSSVIGEILSELATTGKTGSDIALFSGSRFQQI